MRRGEQQRAECDAQQTAEIALEYTVNKQSKKKFLDYRRDCHGEDDDHYSLLNRARFAKKLDDVLLARSAPKKPLHNRVRQQDQRISKKQQNHSRAQCLDKT